MYLFLPSFPSKIRNEIFVKGPSSSFFIEKTMMEQRPPT